MPDAASAIATAMIALSPVTGKKAAAAPAVVAPPATVRVEDLLRAKEYSDRRDMNMKNKLLGRLIKSAPGEFSRTNEILPGGYVGIVHSPTKFYFHVDRKILPKSLGQQPPDGLRETAGSKLPAYEHYEDRRPVVQLPPVMVENNFVRGGKQELSGEEYESLMARMAAMNKDARFSRPLTAKVLKRDKGSHWSVWYGDDKLEAETSINPWVWVVIYDKPGELHGATRIYAQLNAGVHEQAFATAWAHFMTHDREKDLVKRAEKFMSTWEAKTKVQTQGRDNISLMKSAADKAFHVPENPDLLEEKGTLKLYIGCNDWEPSSCWAWIVHPEERHLQYHVYWVKFDYPTKEGNGEATEEASCRAAVDERKAMSKKWLVAASKVLTDRKDYETPLTQQVLDAFPDKDALASCGSQVTEWKVQPTPEKVIKKASTLNPAGTGPEAIAKALEGLDLDALEAQAKGDVASGKVTRRDRAVAILRAAQGMRRNGLTPKDLMISKVPVIPTQFRPFVMIGDQFVPGDANELYRDLIQTRDAYQGARHELGDTGTATSRLHVYDAVRGLYGYGEPVNPKTKERGIQGFLQQLTGTSPKWSFFNRRLLSKTQDNVGRAVVGIDPDLGLDEIGIPEEMAWTIYAPYVQRRLVQAGAPAARAVKMIRDRDPAALRHLEKEVKERPVIYSRAPAWHKFNVMAAYPKLIPGDTIKTNSMVGTGLGLDFDGDTMNVHVPSFPSTVQDAKTKLLGSKMLWSPRDPDRIVNLPKHELVLGLYNASQTPAKAAHMFDTRQAALAAVKSGIINPEDEIEIPDVKTIKEKTTT